MGTNKKLALAGLVCLMVALSFVVGLLPSQDSSVANTAKAAQGASALAISADGVTPIEGAYVIPVGSEQGFSVLSLVEGADPALLPAGEVEWSLASDGAGALSTASGDYVATVSALAEGEAGLYVATSDGLAAVVDLIFQPLAAKQASGKVLDTVTVTTPADSATIVMDQDAAAIPLTLTATTNSILETQSVAYSYYDIGLTKNPIGQATEYPFAVTLPDVSVLPVIVKAAQQYQIVAEATAVAGKADAVDDPIFTIDVGDYDTDDNLLPDSPFGLALLDDDTWRSAAGLVAAPKNGYDSYVQVAMKSFDVSASKTEISEDYLTIVLQDPNNAARVVQVGAPRELIQTGESGVLLVAVADSADDLLEVGAGMVVPALPDTETTGGFYVAIEILVSTPSKAIAKIDPARLQANPVVLIMQGVEVTAGASAAFYAADTDVTLEPLELAVSQGASWTQAATTVGDAEMSASLTSLSVIAPFAASDMPSVVDVRTSTFGSAQDYAMGGATLEVDFLNLPDVGVETTVTIDGNAASPVGAAKVGEVTTLSFVVPKANAIDPAADSAVVQMVITVTPLTQSGKAGAEIQDTFTYVGPRIDDVQPVSGPTDGGTQVIVTGAGFDAGLTASLNSTALQNVTVESTTTFKGTTDDHVAGTVSLEVVTDNNYTGALADAFAYECPEPVLREASSTVTLNDGSYTIRLFGENLSDACDPGSTLRCYFTTDTPGSDIEAEAVTVINDSTIDVVTPAHAVGDYEVYVVRESAGKQGDQNSNPLDFSFLDKQAATIAITDVSPTGGGLGGGDAVTITGTGFPSGVDYGIKTSGNVLRVGETTNTFHAEAGATSVEIPLSLYRGSDAVGAPSTISLTVTFDETVIEPLPRSGVTETAFSTNIDLTLTYGKLVQINTQNPGEMSLVISGGVSEINITEGESPFLIGNMLFNVVGSTDDTTAVQVTDLSMADASAGAVADANGQNGFFNVGATQQDPPDTQLPAVMFGLNEGTVTSATETEIQVTSPAGDAPGAVDVTVIDPNDDTNFAVWRAAEPGEGGFTYSDDGSPYMTAVSPDRAWLFGGVVAQITGVNLSDVTSVQLGGNAAEILAQDATTITIGVPPLDTTSTDAEIGVAVALTNPSGQSSRANGFTYVSYETSSVSYGGQTGDVTTTAFLVDGGAASGDLAVQLDDDPATTDAATLVIPQLYTTKQGDEDVYVLARVAKVAELVGTDNIDAGDAVANIWNVDLHLYDGTADFEADAGSSLGFTYKGAELLVETNTGPAASKQIELDQTPILLTIPTDDTALTVAEVEAGTTSTYSVDTLLEASDIGLEVGAMLFSDDPDSETYQSTVAPAAVTEEYTSSDSTNVDTVTMRIYHLSAYALRTGTTPEAGFIEDDPGTPGHDALDPVEGPVGTQVTIYGQGFNHATQVLFGECEADFTIVNDFTIVATAPDPSCGIKQELPVDITVVITGVGDITLPGAFTYQLGPLPTLTSITPDEAWAFGGVVAHVVGTNLEADGSSEVYIGGVLAENAPGMTNDATNLYVIVPANAAPTANATDLAAVQLRNPSTGATGTTADAFTYVNYQQDDAGDGVQIMTTAFAYDGAAEGGSGDQTVQLPDSADTATLSLPQLYDGAKQGSQDVFVLARAEREVDTSDVLGTDNITFGTPIADSWNFGIHLYDGEYDTETGGFGELDVKALFTNPLKVDVDTAALLTIPMTDAGLLVADVAAVSMFSVDSNLPGDADGLSTDFATLNGTYEVESDMIRFQSPVTYESADSVNVDTVTAALYHLSAFSLRAEITCVAPALTAINPTSQRISETVQVTGTNLTTVSAVEFDGVQADFTLVSDTELSVVVPDPGVEVPEEGLVVDVVAISTCGTSGALSFTVLPECLPPTVTAITPSAGYEGQNVTITGTNLDNTLSVTFGANAATIVGTPTNTSMTVTVPAPETPLEAPDYTLDVTVTVTNECGVDASQTFTYGLRSEFAPQITKITPMAGETNVADQEAVIEGKNLTGADISFGSKKAKRVKGAKQTDDSVVVSVPTSGTPGTVDVTATNDAGSFTWPDGYLYYPEGEANVRRIFSIWPSDAWLIGGITAQIRGTALTTSETNPGALVVNFSSEVAATTFEVIEVNSEELRATVKIPPLKGITDGQKVLGDVFATGQSDYLQDFTYWRYRGNEDTAITTAFNLDDKAATKPGTDDDLFEIVLNGGASGPAKIKFTLPDEDRFDPEDLHVLIRAAVVQEGGPDPFDSHTLTAGLDFIDPLPTAQVRQGSWDFDIHMFTTTAEMTTRELDNDAGSFTAPISASCYGEEYLMPTWTTTEELLALGTGATLYFPNDLPITTDELLSQLSAWSAKTAADDNGETWWLQTDKPSAPDAEGRYEGQGTGFDGDNTGRYEWTIGNADLVDASAVAKPGTPTAEMVRVGLYNVGGAVSLRTGISAPETFLGKRYPDKGGEIVDGEEVQLVTEACVCVKVTPPWQRTATKGKQLLEGEDLPVTILGTGIGSVMRIIMREGDADIVTVLDLTDGGAKAVTEDVFDVAWTDNKITFRKPVADDLPEEFAALFDPQPELGNAFGLIPTNKKLNVIVEVADAATGSSKQIPGTRVVPGDLTFRLKGPINQYTAAVLGFCPFLPGLPGLPGGGGLGLLALIGLGAAAGGGGGGGGGTCFIATAAYGTPLAEQIDVLRAVRDTYLLDNAVGSAFVDMYYRLSPPIADAVAKSPVLAATVRTVLTPVVLLSRIVLVAPMASLLSMVVLGALVVRRRRKARQTKA